MVGDIESNVVDGPISWRAPSADLRGRKKTDHFGPVRLAEALVQGRPNKTMPGRLTVGRLSPQVGDGDLRAVAQAHFGKDRADVVAHGAFAHISGGSDLLVVETAGDELCDFELAVG